jgi:hypothetical protein
MKARYCIIFTGINKQFCSVQSLSYGHYERKMLHTPCINPLNAELNPICNLLILLGDLTFMSKCIASISDKMQRYTVNLYLEIALHVSGGTSTHHQERIQLYLQHLLFVTQLLLSDAIVEELEPVWVCCGWRTWMCFQPAVVCFTRPRLETHPPRLLYGNRRL